MLSAPTDELGRIEAKRAELRVALKTAPAKQRPAIMAQLNDLGNLHFGLSSRDPEQADEIKRAAPAVEWAQFAPDGTYTVVSGAEMRAQLQRAGHRVPNHREGKAPAAVRVAPRARSQLPTVRPRARASAARGACRAGPDDDSDLDDPDPPPLSFEDFRRATSKLSGPERLARFLELPPESQDEAWADLRARLHREQAG